MEYLSVAQIARRWDVSERSVRNYCSSGRVAGAVLDGKTWLIPADAAKPARKNASLKAGLPTPTTLDSPLLAALREQKRTNLPGGIYHKLQVDLTYSSNHMEGSRLTHDQTRWIFETSTVGVCDEPLRVDDLVETVNHFRCIDLVIDRAHEPLSQGFIKQLHAVLKRGTSDASRSWFAVGEYKRMPSEVGGSVTTPPKDVPAAMESLVTGYERAAAGRCLGIEDLAAFHVSFERIHPFQDGNGRVGRLLLLKECLRHGIVPFVVGEDLKLFYYRGLKEWDVAPSYLIDTLLTAQDRFKAALDYFEIAY